MVVLAMTLCVSFIIPLKVWIPVHNTLYNWSEITARLTQYNKYPFEYLFISFAKSYFIANMLSIKVERTNVSF